MCDHGNSSVDIATLVLTVMILFVLIIWAALETKQLYVFKEIASHMSGGMDKLRTA